jgi:hypothetical protein
VGNPITKQSAQQIAKTWIARFIKFNVVGFAGFLVGTAVFALVFPYLGAWAWLFASGSGSIIQFSLIGYFNKKKRGVMFEQCPSS